MPHIYLATMLKDTSGNWTAPGGVPFTVAMDFGNSSQLADAVTPRQCLIVYPHAITHRNLIPLGNDPEVSLTLVQKSAIEEAAGLTSGTLVNRNLHLILRELQVGLPDPSGVTRWKPRRGTPRDGFNITLPYFDNVLPRERFDPAHDAWGNVVETFRADYIREREKSGFTIRDLESLQKWTWTKRREMRLSLADLLPPRYVTDGELTPASKFADDFTEAVDTAIASHTPTGPDAGTSWLLISTSGLEVNSNQASNDTSGAPDRNAMMTDDLSSENMRSQADVTISGTGSERYAGPHLRMSGTSGGADHTCYNCQLVDPADKIQIVEYVSGTGNIRAFSSFTVGTGTTYTVKGEVNGSDVINVYIDAATTPDVTYTDATPITGNKKGGILSRNNNIANGSQLDNFFYEDLAGLQLENIERHYPRGAMRGGLRGVL